MVGFILTIILFIISFLMIIIGFLMAPDSNSFTGALVGSSDLKLFSQFSEIFNGFSKNSPKISEFEKNLPGFPVCLMALFHGKKPKGKSIYIPAEIVYNKDKF